MNLYEKLKHLICKEFNLTQAEFDLKNRDRRVVTARCVFCYTLKDHMGTSTTDIGRLINNTKPWMVNYYLREMQNRIDGRDKEAIILFDIIQKEFSKVLKTIQQWNKEGQQVYVSRARQTSLSRGTYLRVWENSHPRRLILRKRF